MKSDVGGNGALKEHKYAEMVKKKALDSLLDQGGNSAFVQSYFYSLRV